MISFLRSKKRIITTVLTSVFLAVSVFTAVFYIVGPSSTYFMSDCSDTIYWAKASIDGKSLMNSDFNYAAILPFGGTTIMIPLVALFGVSMKAQHIGMALFALLMFFSVYFLVRSMKKSIPAALFTTGVFALSLCCSEKVREIFYEHVIYYSLCGFLICTLLGLYLRYYDAITGKKSKVLVVSLIVTAILGFGSGLDSTQIIAAGIMPVLFAVVMDIFFDKDEKIISKSNLFRIYFCIILGVTALIGLIAIKCSTDVTAGYENAYSTYSAVKDWTVNIGKLPLHWFELFGITDTDSVAMFSVKSVSILIRLAASLIIALSPVISLFFIKHFDRYVRIALFTHLGSTGVILFGYIFGSLSSAGWRLCPLIYTGIVCTLAVFMSLGEYVVPQRIAAVCLCFIIAFDGLCLLDIINIRDRTIKDNSKYRITQLLMENDLKYGYATFWNSQTITVLSDSEVQCANVDIDAQGVWTWYYQSNKNWYKENKDIDKYFLLISDPEMTELIKSEEWLEISDRFSEQIHTDGFTVLVFDSNFFVQN